MATLGEVRRIALAMPGAVEGDGRFAVSIAVGGKQKGFVWSWLERVHPKKGRVENRDVLAVRVADLEEKELLLAADPAKFFTEPHYNGYPAVLVRLANIEADELEGLIREAWRCTSVQASRRRLRASRPRAAS